MPFLPNRFSPPEWLIQYYSIAAMAIFRIHILKKLARINEPSRSLKARERYEQA